jgi:hypothetical protein
VIEANKIDFVIEANKIDFDFDFDRLLIGIRQASKSQETLDAPRKRETRIKGFMAS